LNTQKSNLIYFASYYAILAMTSPSESYVVSFSGKGKVFGTTS